MAIGLEPRPKKARFYLTLRYESVIANPYDVRVDVTNHPNVSPMASYMHGTPVMTWNGQVSAQVEIPGTSRVDDDECWCDRVAGIDVETLLDRARNEYSVSYVPRKNEEGQYVGERGGEKYRIVGVEVPRCGYYYCKRNDAGHADFDPSLTPIPLTLP